MLDYARSWTSLTDILSISMTIAPRPEPDKLPASSMTFASPSYVSGEPAHVNQNTKRDALDQREAEREADVDFLMAEMEKLVAAAASGDDEPSATPRTRVKRTVIPHIGSPDATPRAQKSEADIDDMLAELIVSVEGDDCAREQKSEADIDDIIAEITASVGEDDVQPAVAPTPAPAPAPAQEQAAAPAEVVTEVTAQELEAIQRENQTLRAQLEAKPVDTGTGFGTQAIVVAGVVFAVVSVIMQLRR